MDYYDDYDALPVDLESMDEIPLGDNIPKGYGNLSKRRGYLGGKRKLKKTIKKNMKKQNRKMRKSKKNKKSRKH